MSTTHRYQIHGVLPRKIRSLLELHQSPAVTVCVSGCDVCVCLDFYSTPPVNEESTTYPKTIIGERIQRAKYWSGRPDRERARSELMKSATAYVAAHPVLSTATAVAPMPGSELGSPAADSLPSVVATAIGSRLGVGFADLRRSRKPDAPQKGISEAKAADENQRDTMAASGLVDRVLIVDDTLRYGSTAREACRALRTAGATRVFMLSLAKDLKGTEGGFFSD